MTILLTYLVKALFVLFLIYTIVYITQWIIGLYMAIGHLSHYQAHQEGVREMLPDNVAERTPVSVIIPAYNEADCISDTISSLLDEDYPQLNIYVVDDGSTDGMADLVIRQFGLSPETCSFTPTLETKPVRQCFCREMPGRRITLICKENGGKADALNCGLNFCKDAYCTILDADTRVERGAIRILCSRFLLDPETIVCAGAVRNSLYGTEKYRSLPLTERWLVQYQQLEYFRTFYMQRPLFDHINANIIVSGAFAMFDSQLVKEVGGYRVNTIGEDMELTMRLHAFCMSQRRKYHIAYVAEARCQTQVPFHYHDFYQQRRRWHIGMIQSLHQHIYMLGSHHYGWAGVMSSTFILFYELLAPFLELLGLATLVTAAMVSILDPLFALKASIAYALLVQLTQYALLLGLHVYHAENVPPAEQGKLLLISVLEFLFFHPYNLFIKLNAFFTSRRHQKTWQHIERSQSSEESDAQPVQTAGK